MATIGEVKVNLRVGTEDLEAMLSYHLRAVESIKETIERLKANHEKGLREKYHAECQEAWDLDDEVVMPSFEHWCKQKAATDANGP